MHNLLPARGGSLATVVYSDRHFRYGLPLDVAAVAAPPPRPASPPPAGAGPLLAASAPVAPPPPRYRPQRRARRDAPRVFSSPPPPPAPGGRAVRGLAYRQSERGLSSAGAVARPAAGAPAARRSLRRSSSSAAPLPQFARPSPPPSPFYERVYELALGKRPPSVAEANLAGVGAGVDKLYEKAGHDRKVLNTERYNNGAWAPPAPDAPLPRGAVRAVLACSGALYALALVAFYFLSLA